MELKNDEERAAHAAYMREYNRANAARLDAQKRDRRARETSEERAARLTKKRASHARRFAEGFRPKRSEAEIEANRERSKNFYHEKRKGSPAELERSRIAQRESQARARAAAKAAGPEAFAAWEAAEKRRRKEDRIAKKYSISLADYEVLTSRPCEICGKAPPDVTIRCDHDHHTGKIRGPLCDGCNLAIGHAREDINVLRSAIAYLEKHAQTTQHSNAAQGEQRT